MADVNLSTTESLKVGLTDIVSALGKSTSTTLVEYLIAGETIFPSGYDIAGVAGDGITMKERALSDNWLAVLGSNFTISGLVLPASSLTLSLTVPLGAAFIAGRYLSIPATVLTFSPSITSYVYLKVTRDANLNVTGAWYEVNTTGVEPADSTVIGTVITSAGAITSTVDRRGIGPVMPYRGPRTIGAGSTQLHEGSVTIASSQALSGVHFYTDFMLNVGQTLTIADNAGRLCIMASGTITINGTIDGIGAGGDGAPTTPINTNGRKGGDGTSQPGGGGGGGASGVGGDGGNGGHAVGGRGAVGSGAQGQNNTGELVGIANPLSIFGGGGGGGGGGGDAATETGGAGGNGGASIVLVAPTVVLGSASVLNTSGLAGSNGVTVAALGGGGGGGGSAGNVYVFARSFTDNGATFTQTAGSGGSGAGGAGNGAAGRAGVKQIILY